MPHRKVDCSSRRAVTVTTTNTAAAGAQAGPEGGRQSPDLLFYIINLNCLTHPRIIKDILYDIGNITPYFPCAG